MNKRFIQCCTVTLVLSFTSQYLVAGGLFKTITNQTNKIPEPVKKYTLPFILAAYPAYLLSQLFWKKTSSIALKLDSWTISKIPMIKKLSFNNLATWYNEKYPSQEPDTQKHVTEKQLNDKLTLYISRLEMVTTLHSYAKKEELLDNAFKTAQYATET